MAKFGNRAPVWPSLFEPMLKTGKSGRVRPSSCKRPPWNRIRCVTGSWITLVATIWPTLPGAGRQGVLSKHEPDREAGFALFLDERGVGASVGNGTGQRAEVSTGKRLHEREWYRVSADYRLTNFWTVPPNWAM